MITDINSLVSGAGKSSTGTSTTPSAIGTVAKLSSELKLIDGMQPIQITSVKNAQSASGNHQLIGVTRNDQQQYTLINDKPSANLQAGDKGVINVTGNQVTLTINTSNTAPVAQNTSPNGANSTASPSSTQPPVALTTALKGDTGVKNSVNHNTPSPSVAAQQPKTLAAIAIASRPITLTVISSHLNSPAPSTAITQNNNVNSANTVQAHSASSPAPTSAQPVASASPPTQTPQSVADKSTSVLSSTTLYSAVVSDGHEEFVLTTKHPLKPGDTLPVMVDKHGQLQLYPTHSVSSTATTLTEGLKQTLPKQITPQEFASLIRQLSTLADAQTTSALPDKLSAAIDHLVKQLPNLQSLTQSSEGIKQAIQSSGIFSEHHLVQKTHLDSDLKLNLARLEGVNTELSKQGSTTLQANNTLPSLNMVAGAIERITTSQVKHLIENAQQDGSILPLNIEIPIKDGQATSVVQLQIDKDSADKNTQEPHKRKWLVQLKFDFEETGRFEARASVQEKKVGVMFAVEDAHTERLIRERLNDLRENLRRRNVEIETLDCFRATLKDQKNQYQEASHKRLIDVRT